MAHRFFTTTLLAGNDIVLADTAHVHQITRVLRLAPGDTFILNCGDGEDVEVEIVPNEKNNAYTGGRSPVIQLRVLSRTPAWVPSIHLEICLAKIRKERFEWALEKCTELGVSKMTPITTERSERGVVSGSRANKIIQEASEQCGRGDIPKYGDLIDLDEAISTAAKSGRIVLSCVHNGSPFSQSLMSDVYQAQPSLLSVFIGPEGGWSPAELLLFKTYKVTEVSLGPTNLRAETAAITACALVHTYN